MKKILIKSLDDLEVYGHLSLPREHSREKAHSSVLFISGGIHGSAYDASGKNYDPLHQAIVDYFNSKGYVTLILDKRGSKGYGDEYQGLVDCLGDETLDIIAGGQYLQELPSVDNGRIAIHGTSRSATLAARVLQKTDVFKKGVLASGFYDLHKQYMYDEEFRRNMSPTRKSLGGKAIREVPHEERSPINFASRIQCPILLVHGRDDEISPLVFSQEFYEALKREGKEVELIIYDNFAHPKEFSFPSHPTGRKYWGDVLKFLEKE